MKLNTKGAIDMMLAAAIAVVLLVGAFVLFRITDSADKVDTTASESSGAETIDDDPAKEDGKSIEPADETTETGKIRGDMTYPSSRIPEDVIVCAVNEESSLETCTDSRITSDEFAYGIGYELELPVGQYTVLARQEGADTADAFYDEYIVSTTLNTVGQPLDPCTDETTIEPIVVTVEAGETVEYVVVGDWYYPEQLVNCGL